MAQDIHNFVGAIKGGLPPEEFENDGDLVVAAVKGLLIVQPADDHFCLASIVGDAGWCALRRLQLGNVIVAKSSGDEFIIAAYQQIAEFANVFVVEKTDNNIEVRHMVGITGKIPVYADHSA